MNDPGNPSALTRAVSIETSISRRCGKIRIPIHYWIGLVVAVAAGISPVIAVAQGGQSAFAWKVGTPIVTYWSGPRLTDAVAKQMAEGGWNLVWCTTEDELDVAQRHGLRAQFQNGLISPATLDNPAKREKLEALISRIHAHPALYSYFITDEPSAVAFPALGKLVAYLRERDPKHLAYINLLPTYANNKQLGTKGGKIEAYAEHLRQYVKIVGPGLISYDHYQFTKVGDNPDYFLNLAMIRQTAMAAALPFLNIVQASCWKPGAAASPSVPRVPNGDEMRYLVYTTLAYGAEGISYYVYCCANHEGGIAQADGTPTPLYDALKPLNHEFAAIATVLQPLHSLGVYNAGMLPPGTVPLATNAPFRFDPPVPPMKFNNREPVKGLLLGCFGPSATTTPTHVLVVNLDYKAGAVTTLIGPANLEVFDATTGTWLAMTSGRASLHLTPGGGKLVRVAMSQDKPKSLSSAQRQ